MRSPTSLQPRRPWTLKLRNDDVGDALERLFQVGLDDVAHRHLLSGALHARALQGEDDRAVLLDGHELQVAAVDHEAGANHVECSPHFGCLGPVCLSLVDLVSGFS